MIRNHGFTLLELLLASALTTMLMVGVLGLVSQIGLPAEEGADAVSRDAAVEGFAEMLRADLEHAVAVDATDEHRLELLGYAALDDASRSRSHRPVRVVYRLDEIDGRSWLVREQHLLDVLTNRNAQRDLVAAGVARFELDADAFRPPHRGRIERRATGSGASGAQDRDSGATTHAGVAGDTDTVASTSGEHRGTDPEATSSRSAASDRRAQFGAGPTHTPDTSDWRNFLRWRYQIEDKGKPGQAPDTPDTPDTPGSPEAASQESDNAPGTPGESAADGSQAGSGSEASVGRGRASSLDVSSNRGEAGASPSDGGGFDPSGTVSVPGMSGDFVPVAGRVWRLRVWRDEAGERVSESKDASRGEPAAERIVSARGGGG